MNRRAALFLGIASAVAACGGKPPPVPVGADGRPLPQVYRIDASRESTVSFNMLDGVNALRRAKGLPEVSFNAALNAACAAHARDMAVQNRPWHFGSDGSSPLSRAQRVGYTGKLLDQLISETYQTELETLSSWMGQADTRDVVLDPRATDLGFAWYQKSGGKIWWCMLLGGTAGMAALPFQG